MHARAKRKRSRAAVLTGNREDTLACLRGAVNEVQKKEKDRVLHENVLNVQDPCFLGRLIA
jgi:ribosomal protein S20